MRVIIACAGPTAKWVDHIPGTPPHLLPVDGGGYGRATMPLLARTVRQAREWSDDVHVTGPDDHRFKVVRSTHHVRSQDEPSEFASTRALWSTTSRTVLLLGDVYFTDAAIGDIMACRDEDFRVFGRYGASPVTGCPYGEIFATSWFPQHHEALDRHLELVHEARAAGTVTRPPGWMLLRAWQGTPLGRHRVRSPWFVELPPDLTDDVDTPADFQRHPAFGGKVAGR